MVTTYYAHYQRQSMWRLVPKLSQDVLLRINFAKKTGINISHNIASHNRLLISHKSLHQHELAGRSITEYDSNSIYRDWAGLKWRPVHKGIGACIRNEAWFRQNQLHLCIAKVPLKFASPLCSQVIPLQKCPFCPFLLYFFVSYNSLTKAQKNIEKSPQFYIFHKDVPRH